LQAVFKEAVLDCLLIKFKEHIRESDTESVTLRKKLGQKERDINTCLKYVESLTNDYVAFIGNSSSVIKNVNGLLKLIKNIFFQHALEYLAETKVYVLFLFISPVDILTRCL